MLKPLRYFFFRIYEWKRLSEPAPLAAFTALTATSAALGMHILTLRVLLGSVFGVDFGIGNNRNVARVVGIAVGLLIVVALYRAWISTSRFAEFAEGFRGETQAQRRRGTVCVILYAVVSFLLPFTLMITLRR